MKNMLLPITLFPKNSPLPIYSDFMETLLKSEELRPVKIPFACVIKFTLSGWSSQPLSVPLSSCPSLVLITIGKKSISDSLSLGV